MQAEPRRCLEIRKFADISDAYDWVKKEGFKDRKVKTASHPSAIIRIDQINEAGHKAHVVQDETVRDVFADYETNPSPAFVAIFNR